MQKEFAKNWNKIYRCMSEPLAELTELNMNILSNWSKNKGFLEEFNQAKKPEDLLMLQTKLANIGQLEAVSYAKKAGDIWINAIEQLNEVYDDIVDEVSAKTSEVIKAGQKSKE